MAFVHSAQLSSISTKTEFAARLNLNARSSTLDRESANSATKDMKSSMASAFLGT